MTSTESIASSAVKTARDLSAKAIIVVTDSGRTACCVAKYRPNIPILAVTASAATARQVQGYMKGTTAKLVSTLHGTEAVLADALKATKDLGWTKAGDLVICVAGTIEEVSGSTNSLSLKNVV